MNELESEYREHRNTPPSPYSRRQQQYTFRPAFYYPVLQRSFAQRPVAQRFSPPPSPPPANNVNQGVLLQYYTENFARVPVIPQRDAQTLLNERAMQERAEQERVRAMQERGRQIALQDRAMQDDLRRRQNEEQNRSQQDQMDLEEDFFN